MQELFNNLGINWKLLFAQAANFLLVLWVFKRYVFPRLFAFMEQRKKRIEQGLEFRDKVEQELTRIREARHREIENAKQQGEVLLAESKNVAQAKTREALLFAKAEAEKLMAAAQVQGKREKEDMIQGARDEIAKASLFVTEKLLAKNLTQKDQERLLKEAMNYIS
ncbi:MAG: F-type H+-transporting ATPase subunit b [Parcubacteria group bacterium Greene0714_21]|nr:MAG: F-type H+-transporting ATPase subunit b [Parcubacteria group bacterium Greene0416_39]TSC97531.1 MAG: F-type H+-transporting ATPase subunit b [Parcubacteria group bacterium Greene1014_47]TSD04407.1 MAG: F-type H+-transporting ATPase subunit b [Parcubacteria group bacterium Greene0714_21]